MRVTDQRLYMTMTQHVSRNWERLAEAQNLVASGKLVEQPDDNPTACSLIGAAVESLQHLDDCTSSGTTARSYLEAGESALAEATNVFIRARELAVQGASDQNSAVERTNMALEVREMYNQLVVFANTEVNGCHIFAGYRSDTDAVSSAGVYQGDSGVIELEVAPGTTVDATIRGDQLLAGSGGGVDLFATLDALATALETNDRTGIQASLDSLDRGHQQLVAGRAQIGANLNTVTMADTWMERLGINVESRRSALQDADMADAAIQLSLAEQALEAAIDTVPRMVSLSLIGKL